MILNAFLHSRYEYGETLEQIEALVNEVMTGPAPGNPWVNMDAGEEAEFCWAAERFTEDTFDWFPDNDLHVVVNRLTGFGAVRCNNEWLSYNAALPWDPQVTGDPCCPRWYQPRYVLPLEQVEQALREFCRTEGQRPTCIEWAEYDGDHDRLYLDAEEYRAMFRHAA